MANWFARTHTLWLGFAGLLLLLAVMAIDATRAMQNSTVSTRTLREESRRRDGLLDQLRADLYRSAAMGHEYVLTRGGAEKEKAELESLRRRIGKNLQIYGQTLPEDERAGFENLRERVGSFWGAMGPAVQWDEAERQTKGQRLLQDVILPFRASVVGLTEQITAMNDRDLDAGEVRIRELQARLGERMAMVSIVALSVGLLLAVGSIRRVQRLEREAMARFAEVETARGELRQLTSQLVTAQEEERRNLSRELHDEIGQAMSAMLVELGRAEAAPDSEGRAERLANVRQMAEGTVGMVRNMALLLRPSMLDDLGLIPALRWQAREVTRRSGLKVKMVAEEMSEEMPEAYRTCVYRVVQEALNNCAKHAQATQARVVVHRDERGLAVTVQDDGVGFEPRLERGMGLLGMEERVVRLAGQFSVESKPGDGTVVRVYFPLAKDAA